MKLRKNSGSICDGFSGHEQHTVCFYHALRPLLWQLYECADKVILEVNPKYRRVRGGVDIPVERVTKFFIHDNDLP